MTSFLLPAPWHPIPSPLVLASSPTDARGGTRYSSETVVTFHGDSGDNITFYAVATTSRTRPRGQFSGLGLGRAHPRPWRHNGAKLADAVALRPTRLKTA
jgi:hypothetical protein